MKKLIGLLSLFLVLGLSDTFDYPPKKTCGCGSDEPGTKLPFE